MLYLGPLGIDLAGVTLGKKGAIRHAYPYYVIRKLHPPLPLPVLYCQFELMHL